MCVNFETDPLNCGDCQQRCARDQVCVNGNCRVYEIATPCNTCPCNAVCDDKLGDPFACCEGGATWTSPICVEGDACP